MFLNRVWPDGFEFPACDECNSGSSDEDLLFAMLSRFDPVSNSGDLDNRQIGLMRGAEGQFPGLFQRMMLSPSEARRRNRENGVLPRAGQTQQQAASMINVTGEMHHAVCTVALKLAKAMYFRRTGRAFPDHGFLMVNWFGNSDLFKHGSFRMFADLQHVAGDVPVIARNGQSLADQFQAKVSLQEGRPELIVQARFRNAFGFVVFGSIAEGEMEKLVLKLRNEAGDEGPFEVLQSTSLQTFRSIRRGFA